ncbi:L-fucose isomerase [Alicyclobacillus mali (ex Roth et al. 2021)]|uniref:L-fucose isomerase n=1 Tax=Alicyclobacillus mali (ex Roth et al. 2021) TaxID=1123961 RepID=UPI0008305A89|nr:L-fucose isomerase [Alicyclobacillus mali (ex Roth et al. 2021)]
MEYNLKIGIRPVVDGRFGGIRESLETITLQMARRVAELLQTYVRKPDGNAVECLVPEFCIGGAAEAIRADKWFASEGVAAVITVTPSWCYPLETIFRDRTVPQAIWGFNGTERPGAVYLSAAVSALSTLGIPVFAIYGSDVQDVNDVTIPNDVQKKLIQFAKAAISVVAMKDRSYLSVGYVSMGIAGCLIDESFFSDYLGMRVEYVDMTEFVRRIERGIFDPDEFKRALRWVQKYCKEGEDRNPPAERRSKAQKDRDWEFVVKMALIMRDLIEGNDKLKQLGYPEESFGHAAIAAGFQGQRSWSDHFPISDFMESILCSSFDWNGPRRPYIVATENDSLNAISMLFGHLLTGTAQIFADVRTYWSPQSIHRVTGWKPTGLSENGFLHLINSGPAALDGTGAATRDGNPFIKPFWEMTVQDIESCLESVTWCPAYDYFKNGGFSCRYVTKGGMPVTIIRLNKVRGVGPVLQLAEGYTIDLPPEVSRVIDERTNPTWPSTWFVPRLTGRGAFESVYTVMDNWGSNHCAICYGHIGPELITLASMLRIPVPMHNVESSRIFRPRVWTQFGHDDSVGADFRACAAFGPLYA